MNYCVFGVPKNYHKEIKKTKLLNYELYKEIRELKLLNDKLNKEIKELYLQHEETITRGEQYCRFRNY